MTTSVPHQGVKAQLCGFVINDIILIKIDHCVWYLELYCDNFKACYTIKFFVVFGYFTLELLILITIWSSFCNTCGFLSYFCFMSKLTLVALLDFIATDAFAILSVNRSCTRTKFKNNHLAPLRALKMQVFFAFIKYFLTYRMEMDNVCLKYTLWSMNLFSTCKW